MNFCRKMSTCCIKKCIVQPVNLTLASFDLSEVAVSTSKEKKATMLQWSILFVISTFFRIIGITIHLISSSSDSSHNLRTNQNLYLKRLSRHSHTTLHRSISHHIIIHLTQREYLRMSCAYTTSMQIHSGVILDKSGFFSNLSPGSISQQSPRLALGQL